MLVRFRLAMGTVLSVKAGELVDDVEAVVSSLLARTVTLVEREYPNVVAHTLAGDADADVRPSTIHPAFYGCFDWHSSVHSHWQLVRAIRSFPGLDVEPDVEQVLDRRLTAEHIAGELAYAERRPRWEMPYGMAWLLRLAAELHDWDDPRADRWYRALEPLQRHAAAAFGDALDRQLAPVRSGLHNQTALSYGLVRDAAVLTGDDGLVAAIDARARNWFADDVDAAVHVEPSATDFLSPVLSAADLMRRCLPSDEFAAWFDRYLGAGGVDRLVDHLQPVDVVDHSDGHLAHFAGLNISRAWMLDRIGRATDRPELRELADAHVRAGMASALHDDYMVSHWVPTFVVYLVTDA